MSNTLQTNKKIKLFAAEIYDEMPYVKPSMSYFKDEVKGKKAGSTYYFYLPDPGDAYVGTSLDISSDNQDVYERPVSCSLLDARTSVAVTAWNKLEDIDDFTKEIVKPRGSRLAAEMEKNIISACWPVSSSAVVATAGSEMNALAEAAAHLRATQATAKKYGFFSSAVNTKLGSQAVKYFLPSDVMKPIYNDAAIGNFQQVLWVEDNYMPSVTTLATAPAITSVSLASDGTLTATGTNLVEGCAFYGANSDGTYYGTVDLHGLPIVSEKYVFIITDVNAAGTSGTVKEKLRFSENNGTAQNNGNVYGDSNDLGTATFTSLLAAATTYYIAQIRTEDALEFDTYEFDNLEGCENGNESVMGIRVQTATWSDVKTRNSIMRIDVPYIASGVDGRLSRIVYIPA